jgi:hypothetical protein
MGNAQRNCNADGSFSKGKRSVRKCLVLHVNIHTYVQSNNYKSVTIRRSSPHAGEFLRELFADWK